MKYIISVLLLCLSRLSFAYDPLEMSIISMQPSKWDFLSIAVDMDNSTGTARQTSFMFGNKATRQNRVAWFAIEKHAKGQKNYIISTNMIGVQVSCKDRTLKIASDQIYEGSYSSNRIISGVDFDLNYYAPTHNIMPNTTGETMYRYVCLGKTFFSSSIK